MSQKEQPTPVADLSQLYRNGKGKVTPQMYADVLDEVQQVTQDLTNTRSKLWSSQDELKESENLILDMEKQLADLMMARDVDQESIKLLREANSAQVEEEVRLRDSLELMKKVFTRTQLKTKEDHDKITDLKEEIEYQMAENQKLKVELDELRELLADPIPSGETEQEKRLQEALDKTKRELDSAIAKQGIAEENIKVLTKLLGAQPANTDLVVTKQREEIEALQRQIKEKEALQKQAKNDTLQRQMEEKKALDQKVKEKEALQRQIKTKEPDGGVADNMDPEVDKDSLKQKSWFDFDFVTCNPRFISEEDVTVFKMEPMGEVDGESQVEQREELSGAITEVEPGFFIGINKLGLWARE